MSGGGTTMGDCVDGMSGMDVYMNNWDCWRVTGWSVDCRGALHGGLGGP